MGLLTSNSRYRGDLKEVGFHPFFHYPQPPPHLFRAFTFLCVCVFVCEDDGCEVLLANVR